MIDDGTRTDRDAGSTPGHDATVSVAGHGEAPVMWRRLEGTLVYDSREQSAVGVRAGRTGLPRLMYRAHGFEIDLQIRPGSKADRLRLLGQVLDEEFEPCPGWVVVASGHGSVETGLDDCGHFSIDGLAGGWHRFEVSLPHATIEIPSVYL
jgi:hypothetical protein